MQFFSFFPEDSDELDENYCRPGRVWLVTLSLG